MRQILHNLIGNALQAVEVGGRVEVTWRAAGAGSGRDRAGDRGRDVELLVDDDGPGIADDVRDRIFEPFFTTKIHGAGLGLPICRRLTLLNGGRIEVTDAPTGGARFKLTLPEGRRA
ncbi:MAG: ATP-binding protein [Candidatus Eisenbacteria bacterium]